MNGTTQLKVINAHELKLEGGLLRLQFTLQRKSTSMMYRTCIKHLHLPSQADKMKSLKLDHPHHISTRISDSGYISHTTEDHIHSSEASLSEQTINAMLKPHGFRGLRNI